jgi:streptogramin lyase/mono/diheme cytochrome c family protein
VRRVRYRVPTIAIALAIGLALSAGGRIGEPSTAQAAPQNSPGMPSEGTQVDDLQRSYRLDAYLLLANEGAARGENIYKYKCWVCHHQYQKDAPDLKDLYKHQNLMSGQSVDDASVSAQIRNGGLGMPSFRTTLSDQDVADVVSYLRGGTCCRGEQHPAANPWYRAATQKWPVQSGLSGGARGVVRTAKGELLEGIPVQLVAPNNVRTTVYTSDKGSYEFPAMQAGAYTLRLPTPREFKPFRRDSVQINGAAKLDDIVVESVSDPLTGALQPTREIESQLSGVELLWNLPGTAQEKESFRRGCGSVGCHSYQQILKNRYDERSWRVIVQRMLHHGGGPIINPDKRGTALTAEDVSIVKWLAKVRGPESVDDPLLVFPRPRGAATRVVVTEFEVPRLFLTGHDVAGDGKGNIWYTSHMTNHIGKLDSHTGIVTEYEVPLTPGSLPGTHRVQVDKKGIVWLSENWAHNLTSLDPETGKFTQVHLDRTDVLPNSPGLGNMELSPDGFVWSNMNGSPGGVKKIDPKTGKVLQQFPFDGASYDSLVSADGYFWAGGSPGGPNGNYAEILDIRTGKMLQLDTGAHQSAPKRGGFDPYDNAWFGGTNGTLVEFDAGARQMREYWPPTPYNPYSDFYDAMPDKNGEVWAGEMHARDIVRFDPRTERWRVYEMPEPFAHDRRTWIDNSTNPVSVWYIDSSGGYIVRIQPLE